MKASEKIAKLEDQLTRGLITADKFTSEAKLVIDRAIREHTLKVGEVWCARSDLGNWESFLVKKVNYQDELVLWRLDENPSHCSMEYWTATKGYHSWKRTLAASQ